MKVIQNSIVDSYDPSSYCQQVFLGLIYVAVTFALLLRVLAQLARASR